MILCSRLTISRLPRQTMAGLFFRKQFLTTTTINYSTQQPVVGFIGLGNMGLPMSINLHKNDVPVVAFDVSPAACSAAAAQGVTVASSVRDLVLKDYGDYGPNNNNKCCVIFTMLPGCAAVDSIMTELLDCVSSSSSSSSSDEDEQTPSSSSSPPLPPLVIVDCSTVSPSTSRHWHQVWSQQGHIMLDAPVSGGVKGAKDASLTFMIGCKQEQGGLERARPYLEFMGNRMISCGGPGAGAATKLCNNLALAAQMIGICEAMNLGEALGVDPMVLADVMNQSTAKCWSSEVNNPHPSVATMKTVKGVGPPASRDYEGGFGTKLMLKDLGLAVAAAEGAGVAMPLTVTSKELYRLAYAHGLGEKDFGVMLQFLKGK